MKKIFLNLSVSFFLLLCLSGQMLVSAELPKNIKWQTASHKPFLSSNKAKKIRLILNRLIKTNSTV